MTAVAVAVTSLTVESIVVCLADDSVDGDHDGSK